MTRKRPGSTRATWIGALTSATLHAALLAAPLRVPDVEPAAGRAVPDRPTDVIRLVALSDESNDREAPEEPVRRSQRAGEADGLSSDEDRGSGQIDPAEAGEAGPETPTSMLAPRLDDPRLWPDRDEGHREPWEVEELSVAVALRSAGLSGEPAGATAAGMSAMVTTEGSGGRWGVSPGRLHLGSRSVPTCFADGVNAIDCGFGAHPDTRSGGLEDRVAVAGEIFLQSARHSVESLWRARASAIRERRDAEREDSTRYRRR